MIILYYKCQFEMISYGKTTLAPPLFGSSLCNFFFQCLMCTKHVQISAGGKKAAFWKHSRCFMLQSGEFFATRPWGRSYQVFDCLCRCCRCSDTFFTQRKIANEAHASNSLICQPMRRLPIQSVNYGAINYCPQNINETCSLCAKTSRPRRDCVCSHNQVLCSIFSATGVEFT